MGIISTLLAYQAGKGSERRKRGRKERRSDFFREWNEAREPEQYYADDSDGSE